MSDLFPVIQKLSVRVPAQGTAGNAQTTDLGIAQFAGSVSSVKIIPDATVATDGTNYRTFEVRNEGAAGAGTNKVTDPATANNGTSATSLTAQIPRSLTLNPTAASLVVAEGDVLSIVEAVAGTGVAHGGYLCLVEITRS